VRIDSRRVYSTPKVAGVNRARGRRGDLDLAILDV
jgi:hypothetical protein